MALEAAGAKAQAEGVGVLANSPRLFVISYNIKDGNGQKEQQERRRSIKAWFENNRNVGLSISGEGVREADVPSDNVNLNSSLPYNAVTTIHVEIPENSEEYSPLEKELLQRMQLVASQESYAFDPTLKNVIEIRIVQAPKEGWTVWEQNRQNSFVEI
jgi:hypothetical protein